MYSHIKRHVCLLNPSWLQRRKRNKRSILCGLSDILLHDMFGLPHASRHSCKLSRKPQETTFHSKKIHPSTSTA